MHRATRVDDGVPKHKGTAAREGADPVWANGECAGPDSTLEVRLIGNTERRGEWTAIAKEVAVQVRHSQVRELGEALGQIRQ
jgi:hypothetical protein